jgi:CRP/FNR family transcriptional regulator, cyclic AMP receptor protein
MLSKFFARRPAASADAQESRIPEERLRAIEGSETVDRAAGMLCASTALMQLTHEEARAVVAYMQPRRFKEGVTLIREGDTDNTGFMLLVLDGEVTVETIVVSRTEPITVTVLGAGSLVGEMGLVDGAPRSATCTTMSPVTCAVLTREALEQLMNDDSRIAAKLLMAIATRMAERMRDTQEKLKLYAQLTQAMNEEIHELLPSA